MSKLGKWLPYELLLDNRQLWVSMITEHDKLIIYDNIIRNCKWMN